MSEPNYLTTKELAARWNMNPRTLINWRYEGRGPKYFKRGDTKNAAVMYLVKDVIAYEATHMVKARKV